MQKFQSVIKEFGAVLRADFGAAADQVPPEWLELLRKIEIAEGGPPTAGEEPVSE